MLCIVDVAIIFCCSKLMFGSIGVIDGYEPANPAFSNAYYLLLIQYLSLTLLIQYQESTSMVLDLLCDIWTVNTPSI